MPRLPHSLLSYLHAVAGAWRDDPREDAELLARFASSGDEAAFKALVWRHGPLVWRSCKGVLGDGPDAEDAFQTAFLALAHQASRLQCLSLVGWLHQVARRAALKVDIEARRRRSLEHHLRTVTQPKLEGNADRAELYRALDEEVAGLPERLRVPLLLHYLEGRSQVEVARLLGCARSALQKRLTQGEAILRQRLERRGLTVGVVSVGALLGSAAGASAVPARLVGSTVQVALRSLSFPFESSMSAALAEGVIKTMLVTKMKLVTVLLGLTLCLAGGGLLAYRALAGNAAGSPLLASEPKKDTEASHQPGRDGQMRMRLDRLGDPLPEGALTRLGTGRLYHSGGVVALDVSPDGKTLATGGRGGVCLWEAVTGKEVRIFLHRKDKMYVKSVAFSPDGGTVAAGGELDGSAYLWKATTGEEIRTLRGHKGSIGALAFSPDGVTLATGGEDRTVRLWDAATGKPIRTLRGHKEGIESVAFSPDGKTLATGGWDEAVCLWEVTTGKEIRTLRGHKNVAWSVAFSPDGRIVATGGGDGARLWEAATGKPIRTFLHGEGEGPGRTHQTPRQLLLEA